MRRAMRSVSARATDCTGEEGEGLNLERNSTLEAHQHGGHTPQHAARHVQRSGYACTPYPSCWAEKDQVGVMAQCGAARVQAADADADAAWSTSELGDPWS
jgi:hypothetical protein